MGLKKMINDPHEPFSRVKQFLKNEEDENFFYALNKALKDIKLPMLRFSEADKIPIIYIVGAPRSGTTLLYQLVCRYLPVGYINNLIARFWLKPSIGIRLSKVILGDNARKKIKFESTYGTTKDIVGPHEFGYFWRYWLQLDKSPTHKLSAEHLGNLDKEGLKKTLEQEIISSFQSVIVFKNPICGLNAEFLSNIHPASLFIHIKRDFWDTVISILHARKARYGSYKAWWSLKPSSYPFNFNNNPVEEVIMQVKECRKEIDEELSKPKVKSMEVYYETLCKNPKVILGNICNEIKKMGYNIRQFNEKIPIFSIRKPPPLPPAFQELIKKYKENKNENLSNKTKI